MRVTVVAAGTRGDVQPMLALAAGLRAAGHGVRFAGEAAYERTAAELGFEFALMRGDSEQFFSGPAGRAFRESFAHPARLRRFWRSYLAPMVPRQVEDAAAACAGVDAMVGLPWLGTAPTIGELAGVPAFFASPLPANSFPTREFPYPHGTQPQGPTSEEQNWRSWRGTAALTRVGFESVQEARAQMGLARQTWEDYAVTVRKTPVVLGYSPSLLPKPADWPAGVTVTGFWFLDRAAQEADAELREFLAAGEKPVLVGFGSHVGRDPRKLTRTVIDGIVQSGQRAVLIAGWGGLRDGEGWPDAVKMVRSAPFAWLLPQVRAMVHHGGIGTIAECVRAGLPQVIAPFGYDQEFWGRRLEQMGVGVSLGSAAAMTAQTLAAAIGRVTTEPQFVEKASEMRARVLREDGLGQAVREIERVVEEWPRR